MTPEKIETDGFDRDTAEKWVEKGKADLIAFGRKFLANPDLPERFRIQAPLNLDDPPMYYGGGAKGCTDYPSLAQDRGEQSKPYGPDMALRPAPCQEKIL